jgi:transcriptional regulator with XRE-family HTH domain
MRHNRKEKYRVPVNEALKRIREAIGWDRKRMGMELGMAAQAYSPLESGKHELSLRVIERVREVTGICPYILAWSLYAIEIDKLPEPVQKAHAALKDEWEKALDAMYRNRMLIPTGWW